MPPKYAIQRGSVWHKSRLESRDFYRKMAYGPSFYGIRTPPFYAIWTVFIWGLGVVFNLLTPTHRTPSPKRALRAVPFFSTALLSAPKWLPFVQIHSGNNSKILFLCICICYEIKILTFFHADFGKEFLPELVERSILKLPLSKLCAVPFALQNRALFEGQKRVKRCRGKERKRGAQQRGQKGKKDAWKQVRIMSRLIFVCYATSKLQRTGVSASATRN